LVTQSVQPSVLKTLYTYGSNGEFYWNDGVGNKVQITSGGSVNATSSGISSGTATASFTAGVLVVDSATSIPGRIEAASYFLRYPGSYPSPSGNAVVLQAPSSISGVVALTFPASYASANNTLLAVSTAGVISNYATFDGSTISVSGGVVSVPSGGITSTQLASLSVGTSQLQSAAVTAAKLASNLNIPGSSVQINSLYPVLLNSSSSSSIKVAFGVFSGTGSTITANGMSVTSLSGTGYFNITFSPAFTFSPCVIVSASSTAAATATWQNLTNSGVSVNTWNFSGTAQANVFSIIAVGV
jgi:hypothetical protein